eukprot:COSAG02_NODE_2314_length_9156_cov_8.075072_9_plen_83_part_00
MPGRYVQQPVIATKAGKVLEPMLPASGRERWPVCVPFGGHAQTYRQISQTVVDELETEDWRLSLPSTPTRFVVNKELGLLVG